MKKETEEAPGVKSTRNGSNLGHNTEIAKMLGRYYGELVSADVPDRFAELLSKLEKTESDRSNQKGD